MHYHLLCALLLYIGPIFLSSFPLTWSPSHPSLSSSTICSLNWFCSAVRWLHTTGNSGGVLWWSLGTCLQQQQLGILRCQGSVWRARLQQKWCLLIYFYWVREGCVCMCACVCNEGEIRPPRIVAGTLLHSLLLTVSPSFSPSLPPSFLLSLPLCPLSLLPHISTSIESNLKPIWLTGVTCSSDDTQLARDCTSSAPTGFVNCRTSSFAGADCG